MVASSIVICLYRSMKIVLVSDELHKQLKVEAAKAGLPLQVFTTNQLTLALKLYVRRGEA